LDTAADRYGKVSREIKFHRLGFRDRAWLAVNEITRRGGRGGTIERNAYAGPELIRQRLARGMERFRAGETMGCNPIVLTGEPPTWLYNFEASVSIRRRRWVAANMVRRWREGTIPDQSQQWCIEQVVDVGRRRDIGKKGPGKRWALVKWAGVDEGGAPWGDEWVWNGLLNRQCRREARELEGAKRAAAHVQAALTASMPRQGHIDSRSSLGSSRAECIADSQ